MRKLMTAAAFVLIGLAVASAILGKEPVARPVPKFRDLSLLVAPELPCYWTAGFPPFDLNHYQRIGPLSAYNSDILTIDEHTGTQFDAPPSEHAANSSGRIDNPRLNDVFMQSSC